MAKDVPRPEPSLLPIAAPPLSPAPVGRLRTFRALRHRNYRLYFLGQLVSVTGSWVQTTAMTWLAYELTGESTWPAWIAAAGVLPTFVLGAWGGMIADRLPKRRLIFVTQALMLALALLLAGLVFWGRPRPEALLAVSLAAGLVNALDLPARLAFVVDMVGREDLVNAVALNSLLFNSARVAGPALAGVLLVLDPTAGLCFLINALSFAAVLAALAAMDVPGAPRRAGSGGVRSLLSGFVYLADRRGLVLLLVLSAALAFLGWPVLSLLPALSDSRLGTRQEGYTGMLSGIGAGALTAALLVASFGSLRRQYLFLGAGVVLSAASLLGLAAVRDQWLAVICCAVLGCGLILFFATSQSVMQLGSGDHNRGRIMGIWSMVLSGAQPLGNFLAGPAADHWGVAQVLAMQGVGIGAAAAAALFLGLRLRSARAS
jgi:MFS family permease